MSVLGIDGSGDDLVIDGGGDELIVGPAPPSSQITGNALFDYRVSIFDPTYQDLLILDASKDIAHGQNTYEDTPDGCGAAKFNLGLYYEDIFARGYWTAFNIVEFSTADNLMVASTAAVSTNGTGKYHLDSNWQFDPARGEDSQIAYFWDGINLTMRCPVQAIGFDNGPNIIQTANASTTGATSLTATFNKPTAGNTLLAILTVTAGITAPVPTGWTSMNSAANGVTMAVYTKVASGGESAITFSFSGSTPSSLTVLEVANVATPSLVMDASQSGPEMIAPIASPAAPGAVVLSAFALAHGGNIVYPYGWLYTNSPNGTSSVANALSVAGASATDSNPYQASTFWQTATTTGGVCATILLNPGTGVTPLPYITVGTPLGGGGIPAYASGTLVGRRRYTGRIVLRTRPNDMVPTATVTCQGLAVAFGQAVGDYIRSATNPADVGQCIWEVLNLFATQWPFLKIVQANIPNIGQMYSGTNRDVTAESIVTAILQVIANLDNWNLRVGHDATPRLIKTYSGANNTYTYNVLLSQGVINFEPQTLEVDDQDSSNVFNRVKVIGDNDAATGLPVSAIVDGSAGSPYGLVLDGAPVQIQGLKTTAQCAGAAQSILNQQSIARSNQQFRIYVRNDYSAYGLGPGMMLNGDVVRAIANVTVTNFGTSSWEGGSITPPDVYGQGVSIVTTIDNETGDRYQDVQFSAIEPDYNAAMAERANAVATALKSNTQTTAGLDEYFVSANAYPFTVSGLTVTVPSFMAVFALGSSPVSVGGNSFMLPENATSYAWLNPNNSWSIEPTGTIVSGAIPYAVFTTNASGNVVGSQNLAQIGLLNITANYLYEGALLVPTVAGPSGTGSPALTISIYGKLVSQFQIEFQITNQPTDGSMVKVILYYRQVGQPQWLQFATNAPQNGIGTRLTGGAVSSSGLYLFLYPEAANGTNFQFGVAIESNRGTETAVVSLGTIEKPLGVPSGASITLAAFGSGSTATVTSTGAASLTVNFQIGYTIAGTTDTSWLTNFLIFSGYLDPVFPQLPFVSTIPAGNSPALSGTLAFTLTLVPNTTGANTYSYSTYVSGAALDGSVVTSNVLTYTHA